MKECHKLGGALNVFSGRSQFYVLTHTTALVLLLNCVCACNQGGRGGKTESSRSNSSELYCLLGSLSIQECFSGQDGVLVVRKPLDIDKDTLRNLVNKVSKTIGNPPHEIEALFSRVAAPEFTWDTACKSMECIQDIWDDADESGIFPRTKSPSLRVQLSTPVLVEDDVAVVVADCTDCHIYYVTRVIVLERRREAWLVRSAYVIAIA